MFLAIGLLCVAGVVYWWWRRPVDSAGAQPPESVTVEPDAAVSADTRADERGTESGGPSTKWVSPAQANAEFVRRPDGTLGVQVQRRDELRFVGRESGLQAAPGNMALARLGIFYFNVRGHRYYDAVSIRARTRVLFRREPDNPYGSNAIAVLDPRTEALYGYVNKGFAARLAKRIDAGEEFAAFAMGRGGVTVAMMPVPIARELGLLRGDSERPRSVAGSP